MVVNLLLIPLVIKDNYFLKKMDDGGEQIYYLKAMHKIIELKKMLKIIQSLYYNIYFIK